MKYYCVKQHDVTDCGAACLATVAKQYGLNMPISKIREVAGTDKQGTNVTGLLKAAEHLGFSAKGVKGDRNAIFTEFPLPAIAHVVTPDNMLHFVVIHKISRKKILVADPAKGLIYYHADRFLELWTGVLMVMTPTQRFQRDSEYKGVLWRFFGMLKPQKKLLFSVFLASMIVTAFGILASFFFRIIIDDIVPNALSETLHIMAIGVICLYLARIALEYFRTHLMLYLSQRLDIPLILGFYQHVLNLPMNFFGTRRIGEIISRFMDASRIRDAISGAALTIMIDSVMAVVGGIVLYMQNATLFFIALCLIILYGIVVTLYNRPIKKINAQQMEENAQVNSYLVESLNGIETVKAFNAEKNIEYETERLFVRLLKSVFKGGTIANSQQTITGTIAVVGETIILWVGTMHILDGSLTVGGLITFNALLGYFLRPVTNLINLQPAMQTAIVAAERLMEILILDPEMQFDEEKKVREISLREPIIISKLKFRYGSRQLVLNDISMMIRNGEKIAMVGESGSGKTTLAKLLMNFYDWEEGEIRYGNYNIKDIHKGYLRERIAYISQDIFLFSGTIYDNLMLGNEKATMDDIIRVCELSRASEFIDDMPLRYRTVLEENGSNLSGGQKQRLAIARALLKNPDVLIMDEATSNLDSITEKAIERTINELPDHITTIIIAHRLSTIMRCDRIFVFNKGRIIEHGTHQELMMAGRHYYDLWKEQMPQIEFPQENRIGSQRESFQEQDFDYRNRVHEHNRIPYQNQGAYGDPDYYGNPHGHVNPHQYEDPHQYENPHQYVNPYRPENPHQYENPYRSENPDDHENSEDHEDPDDHENPNDYRNASGYRNTSILDVYGNSMKYGNPDTHENQTFYRNPYANENSAFSDRSDAYRSLDDVDSWKDQILRFQYPRSQKREKEREKERGKRRKARKR